MATTDAMEKRIAQLEHENKELREQLQEWLRLVKLQRSTRVDFGLPDQIDHDTKR